MELERLTLEEWGNKLPRTGFEVFHTPEALSVMNEHSEADLQLFGGFKGQQAVALLPLFVRRAALGPKVVFSPPPSIGVPYLGPVLMPASPKQKKQERLNQRFTEAVLDEIGIDDRRTVFRVLCNPTYDDPRPYIWSGVRSSPRFTYRVDFEGLTMDELMDQFSKSMRYGMRKREELDVTVERGEIEDVRRVHRDIAERFGEQETELDLTWEYVRDLYTALDDRSRVYVVRGPDGSYLSGIITLYSNDTVYYWQGGARASHDNVSVNKLLHHQILTDAIEDPPFDSITKYDLVGANTKRLCSYKAQFSGDLVRYYQLESDDATTKLAKHAYQWIGKASLK